MLYIFVWRHVFFFGQEEYIHIYVYSSRVARSYSSYIFNLLRNCQTIFQSGYTILHFHQLSMWILTLDTDAPPPALTVVAGVCLYFYLLGWIISVNPMSLTASCLREHHLWNCTSHPGLTVALAVLSLSFNLISVKLFASDGITPSCQLPL